MTEKRTKQLAHLFDATRCIGCTACIVACNETNYPEMFGRDIPGRNWLASNIRRYTAELDRRPHQLLVQCQQCSDAPCVKTCPLGANYHDENGLVRNDPERCIGCNYCVVSCPYDARWSNPVTGLPSKCLGEGCLQLIKEGKSPACVAVCPTQARLFGDTLDPESAIYKKLHTARTTKLMEHRGTKPNFFVVVQQ